MNGEKIPQNDEIENIIKLSTEIPTIIGISKQDIAKPEITAKIITILSKIKDLKAIIPFSSLNGENLDVILNEILKVLPESKEKNFYFEEDLYTDKSIKFMSEEIIREQAFYYLNEELPYGVAVKILQFKEQAKLITIDAELICEKSSHKSIIIGKNGSKIKEISTNARKELENLLGKKVMLTIWVKVNKDWRQFEITK